MNSEHSVTKFHEKLQQILDEKGWTHDRLEKWAEEELGKNKLKDNHRRALRRENVPPSKSLLVLLYWILRRKINFGDLIELLIAGLGIDASEELKNNFCERDEDFWRFIKTQPLYLWTEELKERPHVKTRCIISDKIGENYHPKLLQKTLDQIRDCGTEYYYFVPNDSIEPRDLVDGMRNEIGGSKLEEVLEKIFFVRSPDILFFARIRIDNIFQFELELPEAFYGLGSHTSPLLFELQAEAITRVFTLARKVVKQAAEARQQGGKMQSFTVRSGGVDLQFKLDMKFGPEGTTSLRC